MNNRFIHKIFLVVLFVSMWSFGNSGPLKKSLRPLAMGNAFVAVVDDKDALYYNPAGLNLIGRLGNKEKRPHMSHYRSNEMDLRLALGAGGDLGAVWDLRRKYRSYSSSIDGGIDSLQNDSTLIPDLTSIDRQGVPAGVLGGVDFAIHNFGVGIWSQLEAEPFIDVGVLVPQAGYHKLTTDVVAEVGGAYSFLEQDRLAVGAGYRMAWRRKAEPLQFSATDIAALSDASNKTEFLEDSLGADLGSFELGYGIDLGALWQHNAEWRFGAALQNIFMDFEGESIVPELTVGAVYSPVILQSNRFLKRKVNFAADFENAFGSERGYKFFSKINLGAEWEQVLIPYFLETRLSTGFKGGYWTGGIALNMFSVIHLQAVTWADEGGYYVGQDEERYYVLQLELGI